MQNNESNKRNKRSARVWKDKGYYMILSFCILAIGVAGYYFISGAMEEEAAVQQTLSVPVTVEKQEQKPSETPETTEEAKDASAETEVEAPTSVLPVSGDVLQEYAMDRLIFHATTQDWRVHNGVDLAAEVGQNVRAPRGGTVTGVYDDEYYGTTVVISHDGGYVSQCSNLAAETAVQAGDTVLPGDVIGTVGETALIEAAQPAHIHFSVTCNGETVDPATFFS